MDTIELSNIACKLRCKNNTNTKIIWKKSIEEKKKKLFERYKTNEDR